MQDNGPRWTGTAAAPYASQLMQKGSASYKEGLQTSQMAKLSHRFNLHKPRLHYSDEPQLQEGAPLIRSQLPKAEYFNVYGFIYPQTIIEMGNGGR